ncbi:ribosomal protein S5 domain 2-type protein [Mycena floridula]|nr:ribosomal protein S5 domain 2-type protein [Mycena floridula]
MKDEETLKASIFQRLHPRAYLERFIAENIRPDGRDFDGWRQFSVNVGSISTANGSALVRLGDTTIVCGVKAEIAEPGLEKPGEGFLVPNIDLPAMCSPKFKPGPPSEEAQVLSERLNEILLISGVIIPSTLCIQPGKAAWVLYIDATCINYDGNVFDAALIAMVAALKNTRLPKATFHEDSGRTICSRKQMIPLTISRSPVSISFGVFEALGKPHILADPTSFEEPLLATTLCVVLDEQGQLIYTSHFGGGLTSDSEEGGDVLLTCISQAKKRQLELRKLLTPIGS